MSDETFEDSNEPLHFSLIRGVQNRADALNDFKPPFT